jgi:hypothetical protein
VTSPKSRRTQFSGEARRASQRSGFIAYFLPNRATSLAAEGELWTPNLLSRILPLLTFFL